MDENIETPRGVAWNGVYDLSPRAGLQAVNYITTTLSIGLTFTRDLVLARPWACSIDDELQEVQAVHRLHPA